MANHYPAQAFRCIVVVSFGRHHFCKVTRCKYENVRVSISHTLMPHNSYRYVGDSTGFKPDYITAISCVVIQIRKAWTLTANLRFPFDESESILIAEVLVHKPSHKHKKTRMN